MIYNGYKAVIFTPNRRPDIKLIPRKKLDGDFIELGNHKYETDADAVVMTRHHWAKLWWIDTPTLYYTQGNPRPFNPHKQMKRPPEISSAEMKNVYNEWFYRIIRRKEANPLVDAMPYLALGGLLALAYLLYLVLGLEADLEALRQLLQPPPPQSNPEVVVGGGGGP